MQDLFREFRAGVREARISRRAMVSAALVGGVIGAIIGGVVALNMI